MPWKTYLVMYFGTDCDILPSQIEARLEKLGLATTFGSVDLEYVWKSKPSKEAVMKLADQISKELKGSGAVFNLDTHD